MIIIEDTKRNIAKRINTHSRVNINKGDEIEYYKNGTTYKGYVYSIKHEFIDDDDVCTIVKIF